MRNSLDARILKLLEDCGERFDSPEAYEYIEANISAGALIEDRCRILRERTRRLLKNAKDSSGRRLFENVPVVNEDGATTHQWIQPRLMGLDEAQATVDQTAKIGERICRKANALAVRFNEEKDYGIQLPFPWLEENAEAK